MLSSFLVRYRRLSSYATYLYNVSVSQPNLPLLCPEYNLIGKDIFEITVKLAKLLKLLRDMAVRTNTMCRTRLPNVQKFLRVRYLLCISHVSGDVCAVRDMLNPI